MKLKELREKQIALAKEIRTLGDAFNDNDQQWKDEEQAQRWETVNTEYNQVRADIDEETRKQAVSQRMQEIEDHQRSARDGFIPGRDDTRSTGTSPQGMDPITDETRSLALQGWLSGPDASDAQRDAMQSCQIRSGGYLQLGALETQQVRQLQMAARSVHPNFLQQRLHSEIRGMNVGTPADGGYMVSSTVLSELEVNMLAFGAMRQVAETMVTQTGEQLAWPTADDTGNTGELLGEEASAGSEVDPTFAQITWGAYKFSSKPMKISKELLEDSTVNLLPYIGAMLGERIGRISNSYYTTGTGTSQPTGIVTAASLGVTANSATAIASDELLELVHSVDPAYRTGAGFMMHDNVLLAIRQLKDSQNQYLWQPGLKDGIPDRFLGYGLTINQSMASSIATTAKTILFGQLSKYKIRRVRDIRLYRLQELYRMNDQDGFIAFVREDGNLLDAGTAPVKYLQQA